MKIGNCLSTSLSYNQQKNITNVAAVYCGDIPHVTKSTTNIMDITSFQMAYSSQVAPSSHSSREKHSPSPSLSSLVHSSSYSSKMVSMQISSSMFMFYIYIYIYCHVTSTCYHVHIVLCLI